MFEHLTIRLQCACVRVCQIQIDTPCAYLGRIELQMEVHVPIIYKTAKDNNLNFKQSSC